MKALRTDLGKKFLSGPDRAREALIKLSNGETDFEVDGWRVRQVCLKWFHKMIDKKKPA